MALRQEFHSAASAGPLAAPDQTLPQLFAARIQATPDAEAYLQYAPAAGTWRAWSWAAVGQKMARWRRALAGEHIPAGERVALMLDNCVEWVCFDQAAQALGLVVVPLYCNDRPGNSAHILADSGARLLLVGDVRQWERLKPHRALFPVLQRVLCLRAQSADPRVVPADVWLAAAADGDAAPGGRPAPGAAELATLIYTSGTTGRPKGVMLSHANLVSNARAVLQAVPVDRTDRFLSFLPLSHAFERTVGLYAPMLAGACVAFARSPPDLPEDLATLRPTVLVSVPRVYEKIFATIDKRLAAVPAWRRAIFVCAEAAGWRRFAAAQPWGRGTARFSRMAWALLGKRLARPIVAALGGRLRIAVSGGAPLAARLGRRCLALGVPLLQGYGLTEAGPVAACNRPEDNQPESVGRPLPGVAVRLDGDGELLVRGPSVMLGYWNDAVATAAAIDRAGWLHTGDLARIEDGRLFICGRKKEIIVMSTGEKVAPADMESVLTADAMFEQALVVGEGRPFLVALLVLDPVGWKSLALARGIADPGSPAALREAAVLAAVRDKANHLLAGFPAWGRVRRVWLTLAPWSIDAGLVTPTLKPKRRELELRFASEIAALYAGPSGDSSRSFKK